MNTGRISNMAPFVRKIRSALGRPLGAGRNFHDAFPGAELQCASLLEKINNRSALDRKRLLDRLILEAAPLQLRVIPLSDAEEAALAIAELAMHREPEWSDSRSVVAWRHPLIDGLNLGERLKKQGIPVYVPGTETDGDGLFRLRAQTAMIGVTSADFCIAESASLVLKTRPGQPAMVSLLPSIHVAVIAEDRLLESLAECYALVKWDPAVENRGMTRCMTLISGPSKTADIEAVMVHGAHGPREMVLYVIVGR